MNSNTGKKISSISLFTGLAIALASCGNINNSWEVKGGGYFKYSINGDSKKYTIELNKNDCEPPFYVNNTHHYFLLKTRVEESDRGDQFSIMVNAPATGRKITPVGTLGSKQVVTWMRQNFSATSPLAEDSIYIDSSYVKFDEIIPDSLWTADVNLFFVDCSGEVCDESKPPIHITGRLRYYVPEDER